MKRFRTRTASKTYTDPGPDLLRPTANAIHEFANNMGKARTGLFVRRNAPGGRTDWQEWKGPFRRAEVLEQADTWVDKAGDAAKFQVGRMEKGDPAMKAELLAVNVRETNLSGVNEGAEMVADLARNQFAGLTIGGFACREYNGVPGSGWSDHAWGDAVDLSPGVGVDQRQAHRLVRPHGTGGLHGCVPAVHRVEERSGLQLRVSVVPRQPGRPGEPPVARTCFLPAALRGESPLWLIGRKPDCSSRWWQGQRRCGPG